MLDYSLFGFLLISIVGLDVSILDTLIDFIIIFPNISADIKTNDIPEYVDIKFKEVNDEVLELFNEYSDSSIVYQLKDVYADKLKVSTNLYPVIAKNVKRIIDEYFKYCPEYIGVEI